MIQCMECKCIMLTVRNAVLNILEEKKCTTTFECPNCGAITRVIQSVESGPTKKFKKASEIYV